MLAEGYYFCWWCRGIFGVACSFWLMVGGPFVLSLVWGAHGGCWGSGSHLSCFWRRGGHFVEGRIDGVGALFCWGCGLSLGENWMFFFFGGRITLGDLRIIGLSERNACVNL